MDIYRRASIIQQEAENRAGSNDPALAKFHSQASSGSASKAAGRCHLLYCCVFYPTFVFRTFRLGIYPDSSGGDIDGMGIDVVRNRPRGVKLWAPWGNAPTLTLGSFGSQCGYSSRRWLDGFICFVATAAVIACWLDVFVFRFSRAVRLSSVFNYFIVLLFS